MIDRGRERERGAKRIPTVEDAHRENNILSYQDQRKLYYRSKRELMS